MDTAQIARALGVKEAAVVAALHMAREEEHRGKNLPDPPVPAECEPSVEDDSKRRDAPIR
jgi:hypothetical protein